MSKAIARVVRRVAYLVKSWWRGDRIRVSPNEGRLLRIAAPCFLRVAGVAVEVVARRACAEGVIYACRTSVGSGELVVPLGSKRVEWRVGGRAKCVAEDEIEIFGHGVR